MWGYGFERNAIVKEGKNHIMLDHKFFERLLHVNSLKAKIFLMRSRF